MLAHREEYIQHIGNSLLKLLKEYPDKPWWNFWTPNKPWDWRDISSNPNITRDIIKNNPERDWDWRDISKNPNITMDIIKDNPDKPWNWYNICWKFISNYPDKPWNCISKNSINTYNSK